MINKIQKIINNKFSGFFKFVFFLRYLFLIFFVAILLFLLIPYFFDYKKKYLVIDSYMSNNYGLDIKNIDNIKYKSFPSPRLVITNVSSDFFSTETNFKIEKLIIYPKILNIYNYSNYEVRKVFVENSNLEIDFKNLKTLGKNIFDLKKKLSFKNLNLKVKDKNNNIIDLKKINYINYGLEKNIIKGQIFNKKFKINLSDTLSNISFKLLKTGISIKIKILSNNKPDNLKGNIKGKILKSNFKFKFIYDDDTLEVKDLFFRDKKISLNGDGLLILKPFFQANLNTEVKDVDVDLLKRFNIKKILKYQDIIKQFNSEIKIIFRPKKLNRNLINQADVKSNLAYGRLNFTKNLFIYQTKLECNNSINLLEEYPVLYFQCLIISPDKKKFLKKFDINYKVKNENFNLKFQGNLNILKKKINFDLIDNTKNYRAKEEDLKYLKSTFENILFDESFTKIFNLSKIKKFLVEIL